MAQVSSHPLSAFPDSLRGIILMLVSMATFALADVGLKLLAGQMPPGQAVAGLGLIGTLILGFWTWKRGFILFPRDMLHPAVVVRFLAEMVAAIGIRLATVLLTVVGYYTNTAALRVGQIAAVTPFRYSRLIFGLIIGITIFGERPDTLSYVGAGLILATGLYAAWREHRQHHAHT